MQSRYYNPEWGRFLNADAIVESVGELLGSNIFAYCKNTPVNGLDSTGYMYDDNSCGGLEDMAFAKMQGNDFFSDDNVIEKIAIDESLEGCESDLEMRDEQIESQQELRNEEKNNQIKTRQQNKNSKPQRGIGGKGWRGDKNWKSAVQLVKGGGTIKSIFGIVPSQSEAIDLINESGGEVLRIEAPHDPPNPHDFDHINYQTESGGKGTIKIFR